MTEPSHIRWFDSTWVGDIFVVAVAPRRRILSWCLMEPDCFAREIRAPLEGGDGIPRVILDYARVEFTGAEHIRCVTELARWVESRGGAIRLCAVHEEIEEIFQIAEDLWGPLPKRCPTRAIAIAEMSCGGVSGGDE